MLIILAGLPGTGKTTIARELARLPGAVHVRIDSIEQAIRESGVVVASLDDAGYRAGYADLTRIWMTDEMREWFHHLATVEQEIRYDIERYETEHVTPEQLGVQIRTHPKLAITAAAKMGRRFSPCTRAATARSRRGSWNANR